MHVCIVLIFVMLYGILVALRAWIRIIEIVLIVIAARTAWEWVVWVWACE